MFLSDLLRSEGFARKVDRGYGALGSLDTTRDTWQTPMEVDGGRDLALHGRGLRLPSETGTETLTYLTT